MTYKLTVKPCDLAVKSPESLHVGRGATLDRILSTLFADIDYETEVDIHELLDEHRAIAHIWTAADVLHVRPDLDDSQAWRVLRETANRLDSEHGICWDSLEQIAEQLFPSPDELDEED
jgi:hypothetical protein